MALLSLQEGPKMMDVNSNGSVYTIYNMDFSVYRELAFTAPPAGYSCGPLRYITEELFDTDPSTIEFLVNMYGPSPEESFVKIYREDGTELFSKAGGTTLDYMNSTVMEASPSIFETPDGAVLLVQNLSAATMDIYSLPGHVPCVSSCEETAYYANALGTPEQLTTNDTGSINVINSSLAGSQVQYRLPAGTTNGLLRVFDMQGRVITSTTVKGNGTFQFATSDHAAGAYRVSIEMNNAPALSSSFVVVH